MSSLLWASTRTVGQESSLVNIGLVIFCIGVEKLIVESIINISGIRIEK